MATVTPQRRILKFNSIQELLADAERAVQRNAGTTGNWSLGQIIEHLAIAMDKSIDGFQELPPWFIRVIGRWFLKGAFLHKPMKAGFKLPAKAETELVSGPIEPQQALDHMRRAAERLKTTTTRQPHPVVGPLTADEWNQLHCRHAELHFSFVKE